MRERFEKRTWRKIQPVLISVIIPTLNSENTIHDTLSSIFLNNFPRESYEVIVVDNGSIDNTMKVVRGFPAKLFSCPRKGQAPARNRGLQEARGDIICFTDSDVIVPRNWLEKVARFLKDHPEVDGMGGRVFPPSKGHKNLIHKWVGEIYYEDQDFPKEITKSRFLSYRGSLYSANCSYRREVLLSQNGFDETLWDGNDIDLCWRLILKGKNLIFNPDIKVTHMGFPWTMRGIFLKQFVWGRINMKLVRIYSRRYAQDIARTMIYSAYRMTRDLLQSFQLKGKQRAKTYSHLTFNMGRIFELMHPLKPKAQTAALNTKTY